jgi:phosphatidylinositol 4-kinase
MLMKCRLNPNLSPDAKVRNDLEYYIPQLVNFLVFHEELKNEYLMSFLN